eukprot:g18724.t1
MYLTVRKNQVLIWQYTTTYSLLRISSIEFITHKVVPQIFRCILATCQWWKLRVETASTQTGPFKVFRRAIRLSMNY